MKLLVRFLLALCFFVLNGNQSGTAAYRDGLDHAFTEISGLSEFAGSYIFKSALPGTELENDKIEVSNNEDKDEDEELVRVERYTEAGKYFTSFLSANTSRHLYRHTDKSLFYDKHYSYTSSSRYLRLCVIRI